MSLERTAGSWTAVARILTLIAAGCLTAVAELDAQAGQAGEELDAGTYEILLNGELVGLAVLGREGGAQGQGDAAADDAVAAEEALGDVEDVHGAAAAAAVARFAAHQLGERSR